MTWLLLYLIIFDIMFHPLICLLYSLTLILGISVLPLNLYLGSYLSFLSMLSLNLIFLSNLVVSTISDWTPSYLSIYSSFDLSKPSTKLTSNKDSFIFLLFVFFATLLSFCWLYYHRVKILGIFAILYMIYDVTKDWPLLYLS